MFHGPFAFGPFLIFLSSGDAFRLWSVSDDQNCTEQLGPVAMITDFRPFAKLGFRLDRPTIADKLGHDATN